MRMLMTTWMKIQGGHKSKILEFSSFVFVLYGLVEKLAIKFTKAYKKLL